MLFFIILYLFFGEIDHKLYYMLLGICPNYLYITFIYYFNISNISKKKYIKKINFQITIDKKDFFFSFKKIWF